MVSPRPPRTPVDRAAAHAALDEVLDAADLAETGSASGPLLAASLRAHDRLSRVLEGALVVQVAAFDRSGASLDDGHGSSATWLTVEFGMSRPAASSLRATSLAVSSMPHVLAAARDGRLPLTHVKALARVRRAPLEAEFDAAEADLVAAACAMTDRELQLHLRAWAWDALERIAENEPERYTPAPEGNRLRLRTTFEGRGVLDADLTATARLTLEELLEGEYRALCESGALEFDPRTKDEVLGDLFVDALARAAGLVAPGRPLLVATADLDTLIRRLPDPELVAGLLGELGLDLTMFGITTGTARADTAAGTDPAPLGPLGRFDPANRFGVAERAARRCQLSDGTPIADAEAMELLLGAEVALLITDHAGEPLWLGRTTRLATKAQRNAVVATGSGCCYWPGCERTATHCEVDHLHGWNDGGRTDIRNLGLLCRFHNRLKFRGRYHAIRRRDGTIDVRKPDGTPLTRTYHAA